MSGPRLDAALSAMKQLKVESLHAAEVISWRRKSAGYATNDRLPEKAKTHRATRCISLGL